MKFACCRRSNAADLRFARVGLQLVVDMPGHSIAALEHGRRHGLLWVAISPRGQSSASR